MIAVDTNIVVRLLTGDDRVQTARCQNLIEREQVIVYLSVVLESEWVMRTTYRYPPDRIMHAFASLMGLENVTFESPETVATAIDYARAGMDFADALHLANAADCDGFVTFDQRLIRIAATLGIPNVREP